MGATLAYLCAIYINITRKEKFLYHTSIDVAVAEPNQKLDTLLPLADVCKYTDWKESEEEIIRIVWVPMIYQPMIRRLSEASSSAPDLPPSPQLPLSTPELQYFTRVPSKDETAAFMATRKDATDRKEFDEVGNEMPSQFAIRGQVFWLSDFNDINKDIHQRVVDRELEDQKEEKGKGEEPSIVKMAEEPHVESREEQSTIALHSQSAACTEQESPPSKPMECLVEPAECSVEQQQQQESLPEEGVGVIAPKE